MIGELKKSRKAMLKTGKVDLVRRVDRELEAFETWGEIPDIVPTEPFRRKVGDAVASLAKAYQRAEMEYTRAADLDKAEAVKREQSDFLRGGGVARHLLGGEWKPQLNGDTLRDWSVVRGDPGAWQVDGGIVTAHGPGDPVHASYVISDRSYEDFDFRCEFILPVPGDSGFQILAEPGDTPCSVEVGLLHLPESPPLLNLLWGSGPNTIPSRNARFTTPGDWNRIQIRRRGGMLHVWLNDVLAIQVDLSQLAKSPTALPGLSRPVGRLGMQALAGDVHSATLRYESRSM